MTSGPTNVGGLYVAVNLDVSNAMRQLDTLQAKFRQTIQSASVRGTAGNLTAISRGYDGVARSAKSAAKATEDSVSAFNKVQRVSAAKVGGYWQVQTRGMRDFAVQAQKMGQYVSIASKPIEKVVENTNHLGTAALRAAAVIAPGRAGSLASGMVGLSGSMAAVGGLSAGAVAGLVALATAAIAAGVGIYGFGKALVEMTKIGIESARSLEVLTISMEALLGSPQAARAEIGWLQQLAQVSPFLTQTILDMDKFLLSQGLVDGGLRQGLIKSVTDMGSALGLADDQLGSITYALSQVQARGYLSGDELRQLANQFVPVWRALQSTSEFAGMAQSDIRKLAEEGKISAEVFFGALIQYSERYEGVAAKQAETVNGLINNLKDITQFKLGQAFLDVEGTTIGPLEVFRDLLHNIVETLKSIDFRPVAAAIGGLLNSIIGPFSEGVGNMGAGIQNFFENILPRVIHVISTVISIFVSLFLQAWDIARSLFLAFKDGFVLIAGAAAVGFAGVISSIGLVVSSIMVLVAAVRLTINLFAALMKMLSGDMAGAAASWNNAVDSASDGAQAFIDAATAPLKGIQATIKVVRAIQGVNLPKFGTDLGAVGAGLQTVNDGLGGMGSSGDKAAKGGKAANDALKRLMNDLYDLTVRWFGLRSELEKGLLGPEGFTASMDQIASMGKRLIEIMNQLGAPEVAKLIDKATRALIKLAEQREKVAEKLKEANEALKDAISARDTFASDLRKQAIAFANALNIESVTENRYRMVSSRGFFIAEETTRQKSFVEVLRERLKALKDFLNNIKILKARGLDADLLEQFLVAGPEQAGEIVAGIVAGGQAMVGEINTLQSSVKKVADATAKFGADTFYQAGVDQAQALVDGLEDEMSKIEAQATAITKVVYDATKPWAKKMKDAGKTAATSAASGLSSGIPAIGGAMGNIGKTVNAGAGSWDSFMRRGGQEANTELLFQTGDWLDSLETFSDAGILIGENFKVQLAGIFEGFKVNVVPSFDFRFMRYNFFDGIIKMIEKVNPIVLNLLTGGIGGAVLAGLRALRGTKPKRRAAGGPVRAGSPYLVGEVGTELFIPSESGWILPSYQTPTTRRVGSGIGAAVSAASLSSNVSVYIGDQELRGVIRTEVDSSNRSTGRRIVRGRS